MKSLFSILFLLLLQMILIAEAQNDSLNTSEFSYGFWLTSVYPTDKPNIAGKLILPSITQENKPPIWKIAQWGTQYPLNSGVFQQQNETTWFIENEAKKVMLLKKNNHWAILLNCNGITEYNGKLRKYGEPWAHVLIEKHFPQEIKIKEYDLKFEIKFQITRCMCDSTLKEKVDPHLHTAQITAYWTVKNTNPRSPDYEDYFWFGIPIFDARYTIPPEYISKDVGSAYTTNKLIAVIDGNRFYKGNTGDGTPKMLNVTLNSYIEESLNKGKNQGFLKNSNIDDLSITSFNLGWEVTGPYNAEIEISHISMPCIPKK
ncbi:MAG TPA: hypothetical protein PLT82_07675 [Candidatus Hydrogenedens sp.]|nr:hypothetical protein [Candidatus Hydrogenedens sp.]HOL18952.1 hypothetical protein [Candidatus Hydrogenedens sp.]HPP58996.1 hypothetical protein [Candidatus Hydrogenedens sp.]